MPPEWLFINTNPTMSPSFRNPGNNSIVPLFSHSAVAHKTVPTRAPLTSSVSSPATFSFTCHARAQKSQTALGSNSACRADHSERGPVHKSHSGHTELCSVLQTCPFFFVTEDFHALFSLPKIFFFSLCPLVNSYRPLWFCAKSNTSSGKPLSSSKVGVHGPSRAPAAQHPLLLWP